MKKFLKRATVTLVGLLAILLAIGAVWEQIERRRVAAAYPAPGRLVDIGGRRIQIECRGTGSPTVVFETGLDYFGSVAWKKVFGPVAEFTHACVYSRAGIVWSDDRPGPHDALSAAHDLHATLTAIGEKGPFVMAGHSMGGPYATVFTGLYGAQVAGIVYIDASHPDQLKRFEAALGLKPGGGLKGLLQGAGKWVAWTGIPRLVASRAHNPTISAEMMKIPLAFFATSLGPMTAEREALPATFDQAGAYRNLGARPVVVLTHGQPTPDMSAADAEIFDRTWLAMQKDMASWSSRGTQRTIPDSGHFMSNDDPAAVIAAIREVVEAVRSTR